MNQPNHGAIDRLFRLAELGLSHGERPFAALLCKDGGIVASSADMVFAASDPTAHAERLLLSSYCREQRLLHLRGYELYTIAEPCLMCCGAIHWCRPDRVVFCASQAALQQASGGRTKPAAADLLAHGSRALPVTGPCREAEAMAIIGRYDFKARAIRVAPEEP